MLLSTILAVSLAVSPTVKFDFKAGGDAGVQTPPIPGSKTDKTTLERRLELAERMELFRAEVNQVTTGVQQLTIYWATIVVSNESDAAIVTVMVNGETTALFFYYRNNKWTVVPEEFAQTGKIAP